MISSYEQFRDIANVTDMDSAYQMAGTSFSQSSTRSTARRLRRTMQHLGTYRHDLMVAMRVVNNVEQEMLRAEWENWVLEENSRCLKVRIMLRENRTNTSQHKWVKGFDAQQAFRDDAKEKIAKFDGLRKWQEEYCGSCQKEQERLQIVRKPMGLV